MLKAVREYPIICRGPGTLILYKAGDEREKMLTLRKKGQEARKSFTELAKTFQASHPEWQLQQTSQWMNQAQRLRPHFWAYLQRDGQVTEPMMALRLYGARMSG